MTSYCQGDHLLEKLGTTREFDSCHGNVRKLISSWKWQGKIVTEDCIANFTFGAATVFSKLLGALCYLF